MDRPRLSVVIPARQTDPTPLLDSLLAQKLPLQIIIVDDCSEDDTVARVEGWSSRTGHAVDVLRNPRRLYSYGSRLRGMARATAPVVWNVDADDLIPPNARVSEALVLMEKLSPDILHCRGAGVEQGSCLQKPLPWTEPVAEALDGARIWRSFMATDYPPAILWNKFFSLELCKSICRHAPELEVRYFDVKFLGLLSLLLAKSYRACNELVYEYNMRRTRPAWLYARQVRALILLRTAMAPLVEKFAAHDVAPFKKYCHDRLVIQAGHLSIMAAHELKDADECRAMEWLHSHILPNLPLADLISSLKLSMAANTLRLWRLGSLLGCRETWRTMAVPAGVRGSSGKNAPGTGRFPFSPGQALALLMANARLARLLTAVLAPKTDITRQAN